MKNRFNNWLKQTRANKITRPEKYSNTITTISNHFAKELHENIDLYAITNHEKVLNLKNKYFSYKVFLEKNKRGNSMYSRALDLYIEFLIAHTPQFDSIENQIKQITHNPRLTPLEKEHLIQSRIGQGQFRNDLIEIWKGCAITGYNDSRMLIASHIKPWAKSNNEEKIDKNNGLLLLPTYDRMFDLGFISFDDDGKIIISEHLNDYEKLGINTSIRIKLKEGNIIYLQYHRSNIFKI